MQEIEGDREYRSRINLYKKDGSSGKGGNGSSSSEGDNRGGVSRSRKGDKMNNDDGTVVDHEDVSVNMNGMDDEEVRLDELLDDMSLGNGDDDDDGDYNDEEDQGVGHNHDDDDL